MCSLADMWPCSSTVGQGMLCSRKISLLGEGLSKLTGSLLFLKADLCQWGDPYTLWSSTALSSTELLCLMGGLKIWSQVRVILFCWCNYHHCAWGRLCLSLPLLSLWPSNPRMHCLSPLFFEGYPCSRGELSVARCVSSDAMSLAETAEATQQHWLCCSFTACNGTPGPGLPSLAQAAISLLTLLASSCLFLPHSKTQLFSLHQGILRL